MSKTSQLLSLFICLTPSIKADDQLPPAPLPLPFGGWDVEAIETLSPSKMEALPKLQKRSFWAPWRKHPELTEDELQLALKAMGRWVEIQGYYNATLSTTWEQNDKTWNAQIKVDEGEPVICEDVLLKIEGELPPKQEAEVRALVQLTKGGRFLETTFQEDQQRMVSYLLNRGHLWVKVKPMAQLSSTDQRAKIRYRLIPGPKTKFGVTRVEGLERIKPSLIEREYQHQIGDTYSNEALQATRARLIATRWFKSVILTPDPNVEEGQTPVPLMLQLEEAPPRNIGIGVGFGSEEGPRLSTRWMHRNWLGMGWKDRVEFKISALELGFKNTLDIPHYFSEDGHLQNILEYGLKTEDEYDVWVGLVDLNWSTPVADDASLTAGWQIKSEEHDVEDSVLLALNNPNESALLTGPHFSWSQQGQRSRTQWSATSKTELYADVSKGESSLWKQTFTVNASRPFIKEWQVLSRMKLGWADGFDRGQLPVMERFYSGGSKSVRGFARREIGARTNDGFQLGGRGLSEFSIELQHPLFIEELIGALFCDAGQVASQVDAFNFGDLRYGVGFGFGFALPMGLMKLDFGFPLERESWESAFQIHFDFGVSI